jgi:hypothetical protein
MSNDACETIELAYIADKLELRTAPSPFQTPARALESARGFRVGQSPLGRR